MSAEYRGNPCHETARAPTIRYSAPLEFKHSTNSLKSRLIGIGSRSFPNFEKNFDSAGRGELGAKEGIGIVGFRKAVENPDDVFHLVYFTIYA